MNSKFKNELYWILSRSVDVSYSDYKIFLHSHPNFPSFLALRDLLCSFGIPNQVISNQNPDYTKFPRYFLTKLISTDSSKFSEEIGIVRIRNGNKINLLSCEDLKYRSFTVEELSQISDGTFLVFEIKQGRLKIIKNKILNNIYILGSICLILINQIFWHHHSSIENLLFLFLSLLGIVLSLSAINQYLADDEIDLNNTCNSNWQYVDCKTIIRSSFGSTYWNISTLSCLFFIVQALCLSVFTTINRVDQLYEIGKFVSYFTLLIAVVSIAYQTIIIRKICSICMGIIAILIVQFTLYYALPIGTSNMTDLSLVLFLTVVSAIVINLIVKLKNLKSTLLKQYVHAYKFQRNPEVFNLIGKQNIIKVKNSELDFLIKFHSNSESTISVTLVTNMYCAHCLKAHKFFNQYMNVLNMELIYVFSTGQYDHELERIRPYEIFIQLYLNRQIDKAKEFINSWFDSKKENKDLIASYDRLKIEKTSINKILSLQNNWCDTHKIVSTPSVFINEIKVPSRFYSINDLKGILPYYTE